MQLIKPLSIICSLFLLVACSQDATVSKPESSTLVVGFTNVPLDASRVVVRGRESLIGNLISDALLFEAQSDGESLDGSLINGGGIRFDSVRHSDGIYPAGELTEDDIHEMLPFGNTGVVVQMTGSDIKSSFERSVHALPILGDNLGSGAFLQVSHNFMVTVDLSQTSQIVDELSETPSILTSGERIQSILINGENLVPDQTYNILVPNFIADGGDSYVALANIPESKKKRLNIDLVEPLIDYIKTQGVVSPILEDRIIINE